MSQGNASDVLNEKFALNLKKWVNHKKIKRETAGLDFFNRDRALHSLHQIVVENPRWFYHEKIANKSNWEIAQEYYRKLGSYVHKH